MARKTLTVEGLNIKVTEDNFISLSDIAKQSQNKEYRHVIRNWMRNKDTLIFLGTWEKVHNPNFNVAQLGHIKEKYARNDQVLTPKIWIKKMDAIGLISKAGRYGGVWGHPDIAFNFCYWLSPEFQVYVAKEFQRLKKEEFDRKNLKWHLSKITDNIDEVRNLLDSIPGQDEKYNRLKKG